jgi:hypothetical protein
MSKSLAALRSRKSDLLAQKQNLIAEGEEARLRHRDLSPISDQLLRIDSELLGLTADISQAKIAESKTKTQNLPKDADFQRALSDFRGWVAPVERFAAVLQERRLQGVALAPLEPVLNDVLRAARLYVEYLQRIGAVGERGE